MYSYTLILYCLSLFDRRRPAWTDRILYKVNANVYENISLEAEQQNYISIQNFSVSDHKPVMANFTVKVIILLFGNLDRTLISLVINQYL